MMGKYGAVTQYMDPTNRQGRLEHVNQLHSTKLDSSMPGLLATMLARALKEVREAVVLLDRKRKELQQAVAERYPHLSPQQVRLGRLVVSKQMNHDSF